MQVYSKDGTLYHHGVKGMKWGVRKDRKGGSRPGKGKNATVKDTQTRSDMVKKLATRDFDAQKAAKEAWDEFEKKASKLKSEKAYEKAYEKANKIDMESWDKTKLEEKTLREKIFLSDDVKTDMVEARKLSVKLSKLEDEMVGQGSKAYKDAYKKYTEKYGDDDYGFDHYEWPYSKEREQAHKEYKQKASSLLKQYNETITNIGKKVTEGFSEQKVTGDWSGRTYAEWGREEVEEIIYFNRLDLN